MVAKERVIKEKQDENVALRRELERTKKELEDEKSGKEKEHNKGENFQKDIVGKSMIIKSLEKRI